MLLIIDGHKTRFNLTAALIFWLSGIDILVLPAHSTHLLQMFDVAVARPLKTTFKHELDQQIPRFVKENYGSGDKAQCLGRIFVESFLNGVHRDATPANIVSGFRATGVLPFSPVIPLSSQFAVELHDLALYQTRRTGTEVNDMVLTFPEGLSFLCQYELGQEIQDAAYDLKYRRIWGRLRMNSVSERLPISSPPSMFL
jgi:hypothetical protein